MFNRHDNGCKYAKRGGMAALVATAGILSFNIRNLKYFFNYDGFLQDYANRHGYSRYEQYSYDKTKTLFYKEGDDRLAINLSDYEILYNVSIPFTWGLGVVGGYLYGYFQNPPEESKQVLPVVRSSAAFFKESSFDFIPLNQSETKATGVLGLDIDGLLFDTKKSKATGCTVLINEELVRKRIHYAFWHGMKIYIITARPSRHEANQLDVSETHPEFFASIKIILEKIGKEYFSGIYFTNDKPKAPALEDLLKKHFDGDDQFATCIALADDQKKYFTGAEKFTCIHKSSEEDLTYLDLMVQHVKNCRELSKQRESLVLLSS